MASSSPRTVLWEVDAQADFMLPGGKIYVPGAEKIIPNIQRLIDAARETKTLQLPADILSSPQIVIEKQMLDVFSNPRTAEIVEELGNARYVVFGVVTEYCVQCAAKGLLARGREVAIVKDAIETLKSEEGRRVLEELQAQGAKLISTDEAIRMLRA